MDVVTTVVDEQCVEQIIKFCKYPKTDYTYSPMSRDRVELAPGQVAMPNMSRRSLSQFRVQGPLTSRDEIDRLAATTAWTTTTSKLFTSIDGSDDETYLHNGGAPPAEERWALTRALLALRGAAGRLRRRLVGPAHRYPYTDRRPREASVVKRAAAATVAPFYWVYMIMKQVVTTTITTVTETITTKDVGASEKRSSRQRQRASPRRWWPWLLLLLLPVLGYGCYNYADQLLPQDKPIIVDMYKPPRSVDDLDLSKRVAALEDWAFNVDTRQKYIDNKLSKLDNLEAHIEQYSLKYLQQNLIQVFNANDDTDAIGAKLKQYFDNHYVSNEQMHTMSQEIHERFMSNWKPGLDEDSIRAMIQEYLSVYERRQMELIVEKLKEYVKEVEVHHRHSSSASELDVEAVRRIVAAMLDVYDADKTGMVDYALESAGGQVVSTKCTELYQIKTKQYSVLGLPVWWVYTSPRHALAPGAMPAECWAFQGFPGYLVIRTYAIIEVTGFSLEHMSRLLAVDGKIESAPKNFSVYGLHGEMDPEPHKFGDYMYDSNGTAIQYFPVQYPKVTNIGGTQYPVAFDVVELRIESNHGNPTYTCVYRFRVHGNPLSDIRRATEDSISESES